MSASVVRTELTLSLVVPDDAPLPVDARLQYDKADPWAVRLDIATGPDSMVTWHFSRELLTAGVSAAAGEGDVHIAPASSDLGAAVHVRLSSPDGEATLEAPLRRMTEFLAETYAAVPTGTESDHVDLDRAIAGLFDS